MISLTERELFLQGFFRGLVLDNIDPLKLGRIKVNILKLFENIEAENLPWAVPAMPVTSGSGADFGYLAIPEIGSFVWCFFEEGDLYQPVYFSEALSAVHGIPSEVEINYPYRKVLKTKNGILVIIDDQDKEVIVTNPSGSSITMDKDGNVNITSSGTINISGEIAVNINP